jgi:hypothetical protein
MHRLSIFNFLIFSTEKPQEIVENNWVASMERTCLLVRKLSAPRRQCMTSIISLLAQISASSDENEMTSHHLACALGPVLCRPAGSAYMSLRHMDGLHRIRAVVELMIDNPAIFLQV